MLASQRMNNGKDVLMVTSLMCIPQYGCNMMVLDYKIDTVLKYT